jgi:hypothetical protein
VIGYTVNPVTFDIDYLRGDAHTIPFNCTKADGTVQDLTGWSGFKFTVKKSLEDDIGAAKFQKTSGGGGITIPTPTNGQVLVAIASADVSSLSGRHWYDLQATDAGGLVKTLRLAHFFVGKDVTTEGVAGQPSGGPAVFPFGLWFKDGYFYATDLADQKRVKFRFFNRNIEYVSESTNDPPF